MEVLMGKSSINGPFSMAMLNNQRVIVQVTCETTSNAWGLLNIQLVGSLLELGHDLPIGLG